MIRHASVDTVKGRLLSELSETLSRGGRCNEALQAAKQSLKLFSRTGNNTGIAQAYIAAGNAFSRSSRLDSGIAYLSNARELLKQDTSRKGRMLRARATGNLSIALGRKGFADQELQLLIDLVPEFEQLGDTAALSVALHNISSKLVNIGQYRRGYPYLLRNIALARRKGNPENLAGSYVDMAFLQYRLDSLEAMKRYLDLAAATLDKIPGSRQWGLFYIYSAMYAGERKQYAEAGRLLGKAEKLLDRKRDPQNWYNLFVAKLKIQLAQQHWKEAYQVAARIHEAAVSDNHAYFRLTSLRDMAELEGRMGRLADATIHYGAYVNLRDSLDKAGTDSRINQLEIQYNTLLKEKRILELEQTNTRQQLSLQQSRSRQLLLSGISLVALLGSAIALLYWQSRKKLQQQREALLRKELKETEQRQQITAYSAMLDGQEQERLRLARELHDGLGGSLTAIKISLDNLSRQHGAVYLEEPVHRLANALSDLRHIARHMMPETLMRYGLAEALKDYCQSVEQGGCKISFHEYGLGAITDPSRQLMIYRIVQELVGNAIRHAAAGSILVQCTFENSLVIITVEDNGKGFNPFEAEQKKGAGLANVRSRVNYLGGRLHIDSAPGKGSVINIECKL